MEKELRLARLFVRAFTELQKDGMDRQGLTPVQFAALWFIARHKNVNLSDLAGALGVTNAAATKLVDRLVHRKLIERREGPIDRREKILVPTPRGEETLAAATEAGWGRIKAILARMGEEERAGFCRGLAAFLRLALTEAELVERVCLKCGDEHTADCLGEIIYRKLGGGPRQV